jgi:uncharacterized protein (DUF1501 family)
MAVTRAMYGLDDPKARSFGTKCLTARRLVERGVRFVQLFNGAYAMGEGVGNWDGHKTLKTQYEVHAPILDQPAAALLKDLKARGLLDDTLVVWMGEFGRTPKISNGGRDHFPLAWSVALGGGGIKGGQVVGSTTPDGMEVKDRRVGVADFYATICTALGIDPTKENISPEGRPISLVDRGGSPIQELVG